MTNQVPNPVTTNPNVNATNHSIVNTSTNQGAGGHPIHYEWVWFRLEGHSGFSLGPAQMECWSITLITHQELGVMLLQIQQLNYWDVLIEFNGKVDVEWVAQKPLRMELWMRAPCHLECVPCSNGEGLLQFRGGERVAHKVDSEWIDLLWQGQIVLIGGVGWPHLDNYRVPQFLDAVHSGHNIMAFGTLGTPAWPSLVA